VSANTLENICENMLTDVHKVIYLVVGIIDQGWRSRSQEGCLQRPDPGPGAGLVRSVNGATVARLRPLIGCWHEEVIGHAGGASSQVVMYADVSIFVWKKGADAGVRSVDVDLTRLVLKKPLGNLTGNNLTPRWHNVRSAYSVSGRSVTLARTRAI
jgi:hypothetical protein